ncbi:thaumatin family protein [Jidongwangia harbinensis]|uniref:thaumatin family protein n=1 Tax=Jidongwangia harbinensis TaxID=2878561 RepID=UPI001CD976E0|nr:thaumatin family protein [Jidongwangia harbinensis]MCA2219099.1 ricin-type beta-trefoil lectin domain protein [Jidongwangia harbinensis]
MLGAPVLAALRRPLLIVAAALCLVTGLLVVLFGGAFTGDSPARAAESHTVTFVNDSGEKIWIGSTVNADGSAAIGGLPTLEPGQRATISIPENTGPGYWRGKFWARQQCTGESGSTFHCAVGDCGNAADRCVINSQQPASLAEFNFDASDAYGSPWYNVSYVDAVSLPITITPTGTEVRPASQQCGEAGCAKPFLQACPDALLIRDQTGKALNCVNPNRDAETDYSRAITGLCPKAYSWSKHDGVANNQTVFQCKQCSGFTITFHGNGTQPPAPPARVDPKPAPQPRAVNPEPQQERVAVPGQVRTPGKRARAADPAPRPGNAIVSDWQGKCIDVPGANFSDGVRLQVWDCAKSDAQRWTFADGTLRTRGNLCMDVAWGSRDNGAPVQIAHCSGNPAQQWVLSGAGDLVNPQANKCLDITDWNPANGAVLQIWECAGTANQKWHRV